MPGPPQSDLSGENAIEKRLLVVAGILDKAIEAVNLVISEIRAGEDAPPPEAERDRDDL